MELVWTNDRGRRRARMTEHAFATSVAIEANGGGTERAWNFSQASGTSKLRAERNSAWERCDQEAQTCKRVQRTSNSKKTSKLFPNGPVGRLPGSQHGSPSWGKLIAMHKISESIQTCLCVSIFVRKLSEFDRYDTPTLHCFSTLASFRGEAAGARRLGRNRLP